MCYVASHLRHAVESHRSPRRHVEDGPVVEVCILLRTTWTMMHVIVMFAVRDNIAMKQCCCKAEQETDGSHPFLSCATLHASNIPSIRHSS